MKKIVFAFVFLVHCLVQAELKVVTTTTSLAQLVREVGQDQVQVFSLAKGTQDPHRLEPKPSFMVKMRDVDLVLSHGLELEKAWLEPLIMGARNTKLADKKRIYELGALLNPLEIPQGKVSRADGDVHPGGNPHFHLDPQRLVTAAFLIADRLSEIDPKNKELFQKGALNFKNKIEIKLDDWKKRIQKTGIKEIITYHKTFSYFCDQFKIKCVKQLEPKPGIPPSANHLLKLIDHIKTEKIKLVLIENLYEDQIGSKLKKSIPELHVESVPVYLEGEDQINNHEALFERLVSVLEKSTH